jgi:hypothetical protein
LLHCRRYSTFMGEIALVDKLQFGVWMVPIQCFVFSRLWFDE